MFVPFMVFCDISVGLQQKEIDAEEKKLEEDKKVKVAELRRRLHEETQQLLQEQEKQLGLLIARLEVCEHI